MTRDISDATAEALATDAAMRATSRALEVAHEELESAKKALRELAERAERVSRLMPARDTLPKDFARALVSLDEQRLRSWPELGEYCCTDCGVHVGPFDGAREHCDDCLPEPVPEDDARQTEPWDRQRMIARY